MGDRNSRLYQQESYQQNQKQEEALIKYYVYQDLQNLINLIYSRNAVLEHFKNKNDLNNSMVTLSNNKIILQLNLSSGIHKDLQQQYSRNSNLYGKLNEERLKACKTLKEVTSSFENQVGTSLIKDPIETYLKTFTQNYQYGSFELNQFQLQNTNYAPQFNEQVLSKLISSMQTIDAQTNSVSTNGNYQTPTPEQLKQRANEYYKMTKEKLNQIDPTNYSTQFDSKQQNQFQDYRGLPANNIVSQQLCSPSNSQQTQHNNKQEIQVIGDKSRNQQLSSNPDQILFNDKQNSYLQGSGGLITDYRENQEQLNSSKSEQEKHLITSDAKIEKEELILFFRYLNYFSKSGHQYLDKEIKDLVAEANRILEKQNLLQQPERNFAFAVELQNQYCALQHLIKVHYYFELFFDYCKERRPLKSQLSIRKFLDENTNIGIINISFFQYLIQNKELIRSNLSSKTTSEEEFLWEMYKGYCDHYHRTKKN